MRLLIEHFENQVVWFLDELPVYVRQAIAMSLVAFIFLSGFNFFSEIFLEFLVRADQELRMALPHLGG